MERQNQVFSIWQATGPCGEGWAWFSAERDEIGWAQVGRLLPGWPTVPGPERVPGLLGFVHGDRAPVPSHSDPGAMFSVSPLAYLSQ